MGVSIQVSLQPDDFSFLCSPLLSSLERDINTFPKMVDVIILFYKPHMSNVYFTPKHFNNIVGMLRDVLGDVCQQFGNDETWCSHFKTE